MFRTRGDSSRNAGMRESHFHLCLLPAITQAQSSMPKRVEPHRSKVGSIQGPVSLEHRNSHSTRHCPSDDDNSNSIDHTDVPLWFAKFSKMQLVIVLCVQKKSHLGRSEVISLCHWWIY